MIHPFLREKFDQAGYINSSCNSGRFYHQKEYEKRKGKKSLQNRIYQYAMSCIYRLSTLFNKSAGRKRIPNV